MRLKDSSKLVLIFAVLCMCISLGSRASASVVETPTFSPGAGAIAGLTRVTINCQTPQAIILYTTNGTTPTKTNGTVVSSGQSVYVLPGTTLKANAWVTGTVSGMQSAAYTALTVNKPYYIPYGTATVDGDLSEWVDVEWVPLTTLYDVPYYTSGGPLNPATPDIAEAYYSIRWSEDKVYVAIKVRDTAHKLIDAYLGWDSSDLAECCIHTTGNGPTNYNDYGFAAAQEYVFGIRNNGTSIWATLGPTGSTAGTGVAIAGKKVGQWLYYELGVIPYQNFNTTNPSQSVISYLSAGDVIGVDPLVLANDGVTHVNNANSLGYTGMRAANSMTGKFGDYTAIGHHLLVMGGSVAGVKESDDGTVVGCSGVVTVVLGDFFYMESSDRSNGIWVQKSGHRMSVGYAVQVVGVVATDDVNGERYIDASLGTVVSTGQVLSDVHAVPSKNVILMIGDGMGPQQVAAGRYFLSGDETPLSFEPYLRAYVTTRSLNASITDSAAAASAMATGHKVNNLQVSQSPYGETYETILEHAKLMGKRTGLVTTDPITRATPAAFGAHDVDRNNLIAIGDDYLGTNNHPFPSRPDVLMGGGGNPSGGGAFFSTDQIIAAAALGYRTVFTRDEMVALSSSTQRTLGLFTVNDMTYEYDRVPDTTTEPHLSEMAVKALSLLETDPDGFFVMIEGAKIDYGGHANDIKRTTGEVVEFSNAVQSVLDWMQLRADNNNGVQDTLLIVTADHETGGLLAKNLGQGAYAEATWGSNDHTSTSVPFYTTGSNSNIVNNFLRGWMIDNTDVYKIMRSAINAVPTADTITPSSGIAQVDAWQTFTCTFTDLDGADDLATCYFLINDSLAISGGAYFCYDRAADKFYMRNNSAQTDGVLRGTLATIATENAILDCAATTVRGFTEKGNALTISWRVKFRTPMQGKNCDMYLLAADKSGEISGWIDKGDLKVNAPPTLVSAAPSSGTVPSGAWYTLTSVYSDPNGASDLKTCNLLVNTSITNVGGGRFIYDKSVDKFYMVNNAGTRTAGVLRGTAATITTENALIDCGATTVVASGNTVTIAWRIRFRSPMNCNLYMEASDVSTSSSGWVDKGDLNVNAPPSTESVTPASGMVQVGVWKTLTCVYSDPNGAADLSTCNLLINTTVSNTGGAHFVYDRTANKFYMKNNANAMVGGVLRGTASTITTENALIDCARTTVSTNGKTLTVAWRFQVKSTMIGKNCNLYMIANDSSASTSGYIDKGDLGVNAPPTAVSVTPASGLVPVGAWKILTCTYSDGNGATDLAACELLINNSASNVAGGDFIYNRSSNKLYMKNNANTQIGGVLRGTATTISSENAILDCAGTTVTVSGNTIKVAWRVQLKAPMVGKNCNLYMEASDSSGISSGRVDKGDLSVNAPPTLVSVAPASGTVRSGQWTTLTCTYSDPNGATDLATCYLLVNNTLTGLGGAYPYYNRATDKFYIKNNAGSQIGGVLRGTASTIESENAILDCGGSTVAASGNRLTIAWRVKFKAPMAGKSCKLYMQAVDNSGVTVAWMNKGAITVLVPAPLNSF